MTYILYLLLAPQLIIFGTVDRIQKALEKSEYEKALELIEKGLEKEPNNAGIIYFKSVLYFDPAYQNYNPDSARISIERSLDVFLVATDELKEELLDDGVTLDKLTKLHESIRDTFYVKTISNLTLASIQVFQSQFPESIYAERLNYKKDSIDYELALSQESEEALVNYKNTHENPEFEAKVDRLLDEMRWEKLESSGSLADYNDFLNRYPETRFRRQVEQYIFEVSTVAHTTENYQSFLRLSRIRSLKKRAADILYYIDQDEGLAWHIDKDSLQTVINSSERKLFPVASDGKVGFSDQKGSPIITTQFKSIPDDYACELTSDQWLLVYEGLSGRIITNTGTFVLDEVTSYKSVGEDVALVEKGDSFYLYHKSGFQILSRPIDEAQILADKWIKVKRNDKWGLVSYLGLEIAESIYDDIYQEGSFWIFEKDDLLAVYTEDLMLEEIEDRGLTLAFKFDDIEWVNSSALIGFREDRECLLDSTLSFLVPWGNYEIYPDQSGWYLKSDQGYRLYNQFEKDLMDTYFPYLEANEGWLALQTDSDWMLIPRAGELLPSRGYDSIKLINNFSTITLKEGKRELLFTSGVQLELNELTPAVLPNRQQFIRLFDGRNTTLFDQRGEKVISGRYEQIEWVNDSLMRVQFRGKQGLMHTNGSWVLNPVFDSIDEKDDLVLTLIKGKIGCYDPVINELIETGYEERLIRLSDKYLAKKNGKFGLIDFDSQTVLSFKYDNIELWNDSIYLVKDGQQFWIIDQEEEPVYESLENMRKLIENSDHAIYRFVRDGKYGLISTKHGELLNPEFTDVFNIGTNENPLFFADQHLSKAGFHVVSYVDEKGDLILSKAYTREEFELILCDN